MALTSNGRIYSCPCCGFGISFAFEERTLLQLQPASLTPGINSSAIPLTRLSKKYRTCRQCGFIPDLPIEDDNNRWATLNAARLKSFPALPGRETPKATGLSSSSDNKTPPSVVETKPVPHTK